jgi:type VI secretion system protein ImpH
MSAEPRLPAPRLDQANFYQAVRRLLIKPGSLPWSMDKRLHFHADLGHAFPGREITALEQPAADAPIQVATPNYCLAGGLGPLPDAYADWLREQAREGRRAGVEFLDLFNHRLNALRFRLKQGRVPALENYPPERTDVGRGLAALSGLGGLMGAEAAIPPRQWLGLAPYLTNARKSGSGLIRVLARWLGAPVSLTPFIGAWRPIEAPDQLRLGRANHVLGRNTVLGNRVWDQQARVRLEIGPLDYTLFRRLLPPPAHHPDPEIHRPHRGLTDLVRLLLGGRQDCVVRLKVDTASVGRACLAALPRPLGEPPHPEGDNDAGLRLGETAWLGRPRPDAATPWAEFLIPAHGEVSAP